jgi:5-methylthioadenosine/S-adenosylhomocysteine deaminase
MSNLLVKNCDILRLENGNTSIDLNQDIQITGSRIEAITASTDRTSHPDKITTIDARGLLAIPGLINGHAHVPMVLFRGMIEDVSVEAWFNDYVFPLETNLTPEDVYWGALLGIAEMIECGVTCVADHYFFMDQVAEAVRDSGMRANLVWAVFGDEGEAKLDQTSQFIERWQGTADGRITTWLGPHADYTTGPDFLRLAAQRAHELNVGIHIHISETAEQVHLSLDKYGATPVKILADTGVLDVPTILAHCVFPTQEDITLLSGFQASIAHAPKTYMKLGLKNAAPVRAFREAGIPVGLASDGAGSSNTLDILEQMRLMALTQKQSAGDPTVMTVHEVLDTAFSGGAALMQQPDKLGQIAPGRLADIALIRQDGVHNFPRFNPAANLVYSSHASDVDTVICNGKVLMKNRKLLTIDKTRVKQEISARLDRLSQHTSGKKIAVYPA